MKKRSLAIQAKEQFLDMYKKGAFIPGKKLPSEMEMAKLFGISRETWRSTLEMLRRDGLIISKHGTGSYLLDSSHKIQNDLSQLSSLSEMIKNAGITEQSPVVTVCEQPSDIELSNFFQINEGDPICVIQRTRFSESGSPICFSANYLPSTLADLIDPDDPPNSIFSYFEQFKGVSVTRSYTRIIVPDRNDPYAEQLARFGDVRILGLKQLHFDSKGNPVMYAIDYLRCELFEFSVTRVRTR